MISSWTRPRYQWFWAWSSGSQPSKTSCARYAPALPARDEFSDSLMRCMGPRAREIGSLIEQASVLPGKGRLLEWIRRLSDIWQHPLRTRPPGRQHELIVIDELDHLAVAKSSPILRRAGVRVRLLADQHTGGTVRGVRQGRWPMTHWAEGDNSKRRGVSEGAVGGHLGGA